MIVAGDMICFVVGNKLSSAGVSIKLSEKGSVKQTSHLPVLSVDDFSMHLIVSTFI